MSEFHPAYFAVRFRVEQAVPLWPSRFAIITAYATTGETWSASRNEEADRRLHAELLERGCSPVRVTGYDPHTGHGEPGWAVELELVPAIALGRKYHQDAIFFVDGDTLRVCSCRENVVEAVLGGYRERVSERIPSE